MNKHLNETPWKWWDILINNDQEKYTADLGMKI